MPKQIFYFVKSYQIRHLRNENSFFNPFKQLYCHNTLYFFDVLQMVYIVIKYHKRTNMVGGRIFIKLVIRRTYFLLPV